MRKDISKTLLYVYLYTILFFNRIGEKKYMV